MVFISYYFEELFKSLNIASATKLEDQLITISFWAVNYLNKELEDSKNEYQRKVKQVNKAMGKKR